MLEALEKRIGWIAFPHIIRYLAFFQLGVLGLTFLNAGAGDLLHFNWHAITEGQVWRLVTFIFVPAGSLAGTGGGMSAFFAVFAALLMLSFSDGLEERWGHFKTTLFFLGGWAAGVVFSLLFSVTPIGFLGVNEFNNPVFVPDVVSPSMLFDAAILFAFATYYPQYKILLFFFLPVSIVVIAIITGLFIVLGSLSGLPYFTFTLGCLTHYLVVAVPLLLGRAKHGTHKKKFSSAVRKTESFHTCEECGIKDTDDANAEFRVTADGSELCQSCRNK